MLYREIKGETLLLSDGRIHLYNKLGKKVSEQICNLGTDELTKFTRVNAISILQSKGNIVYIGLQSGDTFRDYRVTLSYSDILSTLYNFGSFFKILDSKGTIDNIDYVQCLFIYPSNFNLLAILEKLKIPVQ